jgi:MoaA/NifB/PqqE/SkfB family radical SAM enzyme
MNLVGNRLQTLPLLVMYLTDGCNSRCVTCDIWRNPRRNMDMALVDQIVAQVKDLQMRWVLFSGGEAMQHPEWPQIAQKFREAGVYTMLLTNGLLIKKQAAEIIETVDELIVSLDGGTAQTYDAIRGVDAFDLILDGIRLVREGGVPVTTRTTLQRANYAELPHIIHAAMAADVNHISFLTVDVSNEVAFGNRFSVDIPLVANAGIGAMPQHGPPATALSHEDIAAFHKILDQVEVDFAEEFASGRLAESPQKLRNMVNYFGELLGQDNDYSGPRCNAPHISTVIEVDGTLRPCYFLPSWGKLNGRPLHDALNDPAALDLRKAYRSGERHECKTCVCPLYKGPRSLLRM